MGTCELCAQGATKPVLFTRQMKADGYTILVPSMLPVHFKLICNTLNNFGYHAELLTEDGKEICATGQKYVHNDMCYPAILMIGQFIHALQSGKYDVHKVALMAAQTGGGCRASNYVSLLRKALEKAELGFVPVVPFSIVGIEKHPGFSLTVPILHRMVYDVMYADLLMMLRNQTRPYEHTKGDADALVEQWAETLAEEARKTKLSYSRVKENYRRIVQSFAAIPATRVPKVRVGVVGEIFVKYAPVANNHLDDFLVGEGAEVVSPGLTGFCVYCLTDDIIDYKLYGTGWLKSKIMKIGYNFILKKEKDMFVAMEESGIFKPTGTFDETEAAVEGLISKGVKMGEGWLLSAEMVELIRAGVENIICTQPFGCLPNHISGKGMMKPIRAAYPNANIVAIDYDPGATQVNQENRIKLMLTIARQRLAEREAVTTSTEPALVP